MNEEIKYHVYKLLREEDLFYGSLNCIEARSATVYQIENSDLFYSTCYFSDGNRHIYYVKSKKLQDAILQKGNVIKFTPGTGEWEFFKGELKEIYAWLFVLRIMFSSSKEIQEIYTLEKKHEKCYNFNQSIIAE